MCRFGRFWVLHSYERSMIFLSSHRLKLWMDLFRTIGSSEPHEGSHGLVVLLPGEKVPRRGWDPEEKNETNQGSHATANSQPLPTHKRSQNVGEKYAQRRHQLETNNFIIILGL